jgi:hypothetical protein
MRTSPEPLGRLGLSRREAGNVRQSTRYFGAPGPIDFQPGRAKQSLDRAVKWHDAPMETRRGLLRLGIFLGLIMLSGEFARSAWDDIRANLFGARPIEAGQGVISLRAP